MTYGAFSRNVIQIGKETTAGTAVAATTVWRGPAVDIEDARNIADYGEEESVGLMVPSNRDRATQLAATLSMPETPLTFEQVGYLFEAGIMRVTPSGSGTYVRDYIFPTTTRSAAIYTYTIETGNKDAGDGNEMEYAFVESITLTGRAGETWMVQANWRGRQKSTATLTGSLSIPAVEEALFGKTKLFIDASGGTIGSTQKTGVFVDARITINTGIRPVFTGDGQLYFAAHKHVKPSVEYDFTLELESGGIAAAERAAFVARSLRLLRFQIEGSSAARKIVLDMAAKHSSVNPYQNSEDNTTVQITGNARYSSTDSLFFEAEVTNTLATLP